MPALTLSIVVPCYNEEDVLFELHRRVTSVCKERSITSYELILVNDGSKDSTWKIMKDLSLSDNHVVAINLARNYGHQIALSAGLKMCRGERIFVLDSDLQDPPELLPKMMARMDEGFDVVFGQRIKREGETFFKKFSAFLFYRLLNRLTDISIPEDAGDFRLMNRKTVEILNNMPEHFRFIRGMVSWIGLRQEAFHYERSSRFAGKTKYPFSKMLRFAIDAITGFSIRPLRIATYLGFIFSIITLILMLYALTEYFTGETIKGWTSLAVIVLFVSSSQMFIIGIMSEYLGRLYIESKGRPLFLIQEVVSSEELITSIKQHYHL